MQMKVLMCPVILGCVVPRRPRNFLEETKQDCWGGGGCAGGVGPCPEGIWAESFSQNAMWPSLPHGSVGILRGCGIADSTGLSDGHRHDLRDGCLWWLAVFLAVFLYWMGGAADGLSCFKFYTLFDPNGTLSWVSEPFVTLETKWSQHKDFQHTNFIRRWVQTRNLNFNDNQTNL